MGYVGNYIISLHTDMIVCSFSARVSFDRSVSKSAVFSSINVTSAHVIVQSFFECVSTLRVVYIERDGACLSAVQHSTKLYRSSSAKSLLALGPVRKLIKILRSPDHSSLEKRLPFRWEEEELFTLIRHHICFVVIQCVCTRSHMEAK
jgi:hypothetical protein